MKDSKEATGGSSYRGCAMTLLVLVVLGLGGCKTELGWTLLYTMGRARSHLADTLEQNGFAGYSLDRVRLTVWYRSGYAVLSIPRDKFEAALAKLKEQGFGEYPYADDVEMEKDTPNYIDSKLRARGLPEQYVGEAAKAFRRSSFLGFSGGSDKGRVSLTYVGYFPERQKAIVIFNYRYG